MKLAPSNELASLTIRRYIEKRVYPDSTLVYPQSERLQVLHDGKWIDVPTVEEITQWPKPQ